MPRRIAILGRFAASAGLFLGSFGVARADETAATSATGTTKAHVVEAGETLSQIAVDLGVDQDALVRLNGLDPGDILSIGQSLKVPPGSAARGGPIGVGTVTGSGASSG